VSTENPYDSPKHATKVAASNPAPLLWSAVVVFGCTIAGAMLGLTAGAALGTFAPGYYRAVFFNGGEPHFDPVAVGIGQGVTQGTAFGAVIGLALVAMFYWYNTRLTRRIESP